MVASPVTVQQTQYRLAQHYLKQLQRANAAITKASSGNRDHWITAIQQDWPQIKHWCDWAATQAVDRVRARLCVEFCTTAASATTTQQTTVETITMLRQGVKAAQVLDDLAAEGEILYRLGLNHLRLRQLADTSSCAEALAECGEKLRDDRMLGRAWYLRACVSNSAGNLEGAEAQYTQSRELLEAIDQKDMVAVWAGFGHVAYYQGKYEASHGYHSKSMQLALELDDEPNVAVAHLSLTGVCLQLKDIQQALYHAQETLRIARKLSFLPLIPHALTMLANVNRQLGRLDEARAYYEEVLGITRATLSPDSEVSVLTGLGRVYALQANDDLAIQHFLDAIKLAKAHRLLTRVTTPTEELIRIYLRRGDIASAHERLCDLADSALALASARFYAKTIFSASALWHALGYSEQAAQWVGLLQRHTEHLDSAELESLHDVLQESLGKEGFDDAVAKAGAFVLEDTVKSLAQMLREYPM